jgi:hypothetical protein
LAVDLIFLLIRLSRRCRQTPLCSRITNEMTEKQAAYFEKIAPLLNAAVTADEKGNTVVAYQLYCKILPMLEEAVALPVNSQM